VPDGERSYASRSGVTFKDHFSSVAGSYARYRPTYPKELFAFLAELAPARDLAWDCATGNGQAARELAAHFRHVVATDASAEQIAHATPHPGVEYRVAPAEDSGLPDDSVDLVAVAQAVHWFDLPRFRREAHRVLKRGGAIGIWTYRLLSTGPDVDPVLEDLYSRRLAGYWPPERKLVDEGYRSLDFGFEKIAAPDFRMTLSWNLDDVLAYLGTWSAVLRFREREGRDPVEEYKPRLAAEWGDPHGRRQIVWPLILYAGRKEA
jgi:ubiquinone/menaquinone biosynthesis C-methylase UbiE